MTTAADSFRRPVWPEQFYGGEHFRPDGRLCSYLSHIWCERCNAAAPTVPAVVKAREAPSPSERITVADITAELAKIEAARADDEGAHRMEDTLWLAVLEAIRDGAPDPAAMAAEAVRSCEISFDRWSA